MMALKMLLVKVDLAGIPFVLGVTEETVLAWLQRAAHKAEEINAHLLRDLPFVTEVQLTEMWSFIKRKHTAQAGPEGESTALSEDGWQRVWISFAPVYLRLILAALVGSRTYESALQVIHMPDGRCGLVGRLVFQRRLQLLPRGADRGLPYPEDLSAHGQAVDAPSNRSRSPTRKSRSTARSSRRRRSARSQELVYRVRCGAKRLEDLGLSISTSLLERLNLTLRLCFGASVGTQERELLSGFPPNTRRWCVRCLFQAFYNFALAAHEFAIVSPRPGSTCLGTDST